MAEQANLNAVASARSAADNGVREVKNFMKGFKN